MEVNTLMLLNTYKVCCTFTNVTVDLVSWGTADQCLTDIAPCSIHTALIQLAGVCRQTLIYVCMLEKERIKEKCVSAKKDNE